MLQELWCVVRMFRGLFAQEVDAVEIVTRAVVRDLYLVSTRNATKEDTHLPIAQSDVQCQQPHTQ